MKTTIMTIIAAVSLAAFGRDTAIYNGKLTSPMNAGGFAVTNLPSPVASGDAATKGYVDAIGGVTPTVVTNIAGRVTSNVVTKAYVEGLGIEAGINENTATNIAGAVVTNCVPSWAREENPPETGVKVPDASKFSEWKLVYSPSRTNAGVVVTHVHPPTVNPHSGIASFRIDYTQGGVEKILVSSVNFDGDSFDVSRKCYAMVSEIGGYFCFRRITTAPMSPWNIQISVIGINDGYAKYEYVKHSDPVFYYYPVYKGDSHWEITVWLRSTIEEGVTNSYSVSFSDRPYLDPFSEEEVYSLEENELRDYDTKLGFTTDTLNVSMSRYPCKDAASADLLVDTYTHLENGGLATCSYVKRAQYSKQDRLFTYGEFYSRSYLESVVDKTPSSTSTNRLVTSKGVADGILSSTNSLATTLRNEIAAIKTDRITDGTNTVYANLKYERYTLPIEGQGVWYVTRSTGTNDTLSWNSMYNKWRNASATTEAGVSAFSGQAFLYDFYTGVNFYTNAFSGVTYRINGTRGRWAEFRYVNLVETDSLARSSELAEVESNSVPWTVDKSTNKTSVTIGTDRSGQVGKHSLAVGNYVTASGDYSVGIGLRPSASGNYSFAGGWSASAGGDYSFAFGRSTSASGNYSIALGHQASVSSLHPNAFAWAGDTTSNPYGSKGEGTFCIDPRGGINGFYIGNSSLGTILSGYLTAETDPIWAANSNNFANALLAVAERTTVTKITDQMALNYADADLPNATNGTWKTALKRDIPTVQYNYALVTAASQASVAPQSGQIVSVNVATPANGIDMTLPTVAAGESADFELRVTSAAATQFNSITLGAGETIDFLCDSLLESGKIESGTTYIYFTRSSATTWQVNAQKVKATYVPVTGYAVKFASDYGVGFSFLDGSAYTLTAGGNTITLSPSPYIYNASEYRGQNLFTGVSSITIGGGYSDASLTYIANGVENSISSQAASSPITINLTQDLEIKYLAYFD